MRVSSIVKALDVSENLEHGGVPDRRFSLHSSC